MPTSAPSTVSHVVWDWNGTLLDDFELTARIATASLADLGHPGLTRQDIREHFRRPYTAFYSSLLGRPVSADELARIREAYEVGYHAHMYTASLRPDAESALDQVGDHATQSLLSLAPDRQLQALVDHHAIRHRFVLIEGSHTGSDGNKAGSLRAHLEAIGAEPARTVVIGDTVDDQEAAAACGTRVILVTGGNQSRPPLEATGALVVDTLTEATGLVEVM